MDHRSQGRFGSGQTGNEGRRIWNPPPDYPNYFDTKNVAQEKYVLQEKYVTEYADQIAQQFGVDHLATHQLRSFYQAVKGQQQALRHGRSFDEVLVELKKLKAIAHDRANRRNSGFPQSFKEFLDKNLGKLTLEGGRNYFEKGFVEHFQAVVAYCAGRLKEGGK